MNADAARERGRKLFAAFDACQRRLIEAEIIMGQGRRNPEERARLAAVVRAIREWMHAANEVDVLSEFDADVQVFLRFLRHEAKEKALAEKTELPLRTRLFLESGVDVTAPPSKPTQYIDFDPERVLHPRY